MNRNSNKISLDEDKLLKDIRIIIFLLMLISLGIGLTKTYFTSMVILQPKLNIAMGTFKYHLRNIDETIELVPINIDGIMPGESVTQDMYIENLGTLSGVLTLKFYNFHSNLRLEETRFLTSFSYILEGTKGGITYAISQGSFNDLKDLGTILITPLGTEKPIIVGPGEDIILRLHITFNCNDLEMYNGGKFTFDMSVGSTQEQYSK